MRESRGQKGSLVCYQSPSRLRARSRSSTGQIATLRGVFSLTCTQQQAFSPPKQKNEGQRCALPLFSQDELDKQRADHKEVSTALEEATERRGELEAQVRGPTPPPPQQQQVT